MVTSNKNEQRFVYIFCQLQMRQSEMNHDGDPEPQQSYQENSFLVVQQQQYSSKQQQQQEWYSSVIHRNWPIKSKDPIYSSFPPCSSHGLPGETAFVHPRTAPVLSHALLVPESSRKSARVARDRKKCLLVLLAVLVKVRANKDHKKQKHRHTHSFVQKDRITASQSTRRAIITVHSCCTRHNQPCAAVLLLLL